jgi:hypothetical protein
MYFSNIRHHVLYSHTKFELKTQPLYGETKNKKSY